MYQLLLFQFIAGSVFPSRVSKIFTLYREQSEFCLVSMQELMYLKVKSYFNDSNFLMTFSIDSCMITGVGYEENQIF